MSTLISSRHEGFTTHLYLDIYGNLTYGVGHNLGHINSPSTLDKVKKLTLHKEGKLIETKEIESFIAELSNFYEENKKTVEVKQGVTKEVLNYKHSYYMNRFKIHVNEEVVKDKLKINVESAITDANIVFPNFKSLNASVQEALCIMAFGMGRPKLIKFVKNDTQFLKYIQEGKMKDAAALIDKIIGWPADRKKHVKKLLTS